MKETVLVVSFGGQFVSATYSFLPQYVSCSGWVSSAILSH